MTAGAYGTLARACLLATCIAIASCSIERPPSFIPAAYDLGPERKPAKPGELRISGALLVPAVTAPPWLDDDGIAYRLLYADPAQPHVYSRSRWTAEPAILVTDRLRNRLAVVTEGVITPAHSARADYGLRVELQEFSQLFTSPDQSRVLLKARATLISGADRRVLDQRDFDVERPAEPNASGAVEALSAATDAFVDQLVTWTADSLKGRTAVAKDARPTSK